MNDIDLQKLKELAQKATPGPWEHICQGGIEEIEDSNHFSMVTVNDHDNAAYIAAVSPDVVLELIREVEQLRRVNNFQLHSMTEYKQVAKMAWGGEIPSPLPGHESSEQKMVEQFEHLNCPYCGGSGHIEDCNKVMKENGETIENYKCVIADLKEQYTSLEKQADWLTQQIKNCPSREARIKCFYSDLEICSKCWREAARKTVEDNNEYQS